jgi:protein transport protein SEC31
MTWNPEIPTQFMVANDDDQNPSLKIWDLRKPDYPVATFQDLHYNGILSLSWCTSDPNLIVSSAKDYRTVLLNSKTGERIFEFPTQSQYNKISWSKPLKGKLACMDTEGNTSILSLQPEGLYTAPEKSFATPQHASYAPSWNQAKCGARFGFGNRIVTFGANGKPSLISINHVPVQPTLAQKVQAFDQSLETLDIAQVLDQKIQSSENDVDKLEFTIMKALHLGSFNELLKTFGYDKTKIV